MSSSVVDFHSLSREELCRLFSQCCSSTEFASRLADCCCASSNSSSSNSDVKAKQMMQKSMPALVHAAREIWYDLNPSRDWEEAFRGHPRIGDDPVKLKEKFPSSSGDWAMGEQSNAMATATEETLRQLGEMNVKYEQKFGRIFIICATGVSAEFVLANVKDRMENSPWAEMMVAAREQMKITELRLKKLNLSFGDGNGKASSSMKKRVKVLNEQTIISSSAANSEKKKSPITTHVLDTALGKPAEGIKVTLNNRSSAAPWISKEGYTDADGRVTDLMGGDDTLFAGDYELVFHVQEYVRMTTGQKSFYPECPIRFTVFSGRTKEHYHVPLLLNPFGYGTYRGS